MLIGPHYIMWGFISCCQVENRSADSPQLGLSSSTTSPTHLIKKKLNSTTVGPKAKMARSSKEI